MDMRSLTEFFKWCSIINVILFFITAIMVIAAPDFVYSTQGHLFNVSREAFDGSLYAFMGLYKILIIVFNIVPYIALLIMGKKQHP